jgi:dephospho-CoA kinase
MADDAQRAALNAIVHPDVARLTMERENAARKRGEPLCIADIPLLFEVRDPASFDVIVLVDAPADVRRTRLIADRGYTPAEADDLIGAQLPSSLKRERSHLVIDNDGTREALERKTRDAWEELQRRARNSA